ncbi:MULTISPECIES: SUKH-4 family immunity protein [unclassified Streptomyces]|uniref:SUKH-4 family immunity protein n=1 Tax=unclassified Streptomyces TaxID=2593676 RepID=UPI0023657184|nr:MULTISPECIES: SUKH-4 family immunity protein [unclassified Streptomyces]MDF3140168.1 SUKH-4 family immunity protein [Streptomyces sp. T21Q-yed]WDF41722.1 SUKH-4 family immunity protein [Streptomyces sp. T12]
MPPEQALAELLEWSDSGTQRVAELTGPPGSGRTEILLRLSEARSEAVLVDATGLTCEDLIDRVVTAAGFTALPEKRADWGFELEDSPLGGGLVIIVNAHRAGRTRRSTEPERMVHRFTAELAVGGGLKVVIERDLPDVRLAHDHLVVALQPSSSEGAAGHLSDSTDTEALRALALAEVRRAPLPVWTALAQALGSHVGRSLDVATTLEASGELLEVEGDGWVRFRDERHAETLRRTTDAEIVRAVNVELVAWLRDQPAAGTTGQYLTQGLAMHAVQAGEFDSVQRSGRLVARIDQVALIDAAHADDSYVVNGASPAGDAVNLWMCGVDSLSQGEWASWLHLMSTVRGDTETAAQIASSGRPLPWQVRWAHWRPPGALNAAYVRPGPLGDPVIAPEDYLPGRHAVSAPGEWDERYRVWDAETGEELAGPWPEAMPAPGRREPLWLTDLERNVTPDWDDLTVFDTLEPPFVSDQVRVGDLLVVTGLGGIFAVELHDPAVSPRISKVHGEPLFDDSGFLPALHRGTARRRGSYDPDLFEPGVVRRLPTGLLPEGVTDAEARRVLTDVGLPAFEGAAIRLEALDEVGLDEVGLSPLAPGDLSADAVPGAYYKIGTWGAGDLVLHGGTGQVVLFGADDWSSAEDDFDAYFDDEPDDGGGPDDGGEQETGAVLIAGGLAAFIDLLQHYLAARCMLAAAGSRTERVAIRDDLEDTLPDLDDADTDATFWTAALRTTD